MGDRLAILVAPIRHDINGSASANAHVECRRSLWGIHDLRLGSFGREKIGW